MLILLLALIAAPAEAGAPDGGVLPSSQANAKKPGEAADAGEDEEALRRELEKALGKDAAAAAAGGQARSAPHAPAPPSATGGAAPPPPLVGGAQSYNRDISAILGATGGYQRQPLQFPNGDDPILRGEEGKKALGFTAQEVELAFSAIVDPYFRGDVFLTIPNLQGLEVEEAFATTTSLPWNLQVKGGSFRSAFGRQNGQHLHVQDFTRRPLINAAFLGADGMRGPGFQLSWLAPLPFFLTLYGEAFSLGGDAADQTGALPQPVASFGADRSTRPTLAAEAKAFFPLGESWSVYSGLNFASGKSPGVSLGDAGTTGVGRGAQLY